MNEDHIRDLLRTLARADATAEAPPEIELRLRREFRSRKRRRTWTRLARLAWSASAAAAVLVLVVATWHYRQPRAVLPQAEAVQEVVTDFYPLVNPAPPFERGRLLRVELPASAMRMVGLPVHAERLSDTVQADVLVGEEGLPRAIRFVKFETK